MEHGTAIMERTGVSSSYHIVPTRLARDIKEKKPQYGSTYKVDGSTSCTVSM